MRKQALGGDDRIRIRIEAGDPALASSSAACRFALITWMAERRVRRLAPSGSYDVEPGRYWRLRARDLDNH